VSQVGLFKVKQNVNKKFSQNNRREIKYVWLSSKKAIFLITGEPRESKYSYGVPIIPLHGYYKADGKRYTAKELSDYYVILNLPKSADVDELKGKKVVIVGYDEDELYIDENETDDESNDNDEEGEGGDEKK
jgi:hypothetical protein